MFLILNNVVSCSVWANIFKSMPLQYYQPFLCFLFTVLFFAPPAKSQQLSHEEKIKGFAFLGPESPELTATPFQEIKATGANWVTIVPEIILNRYTLNFQPDSLNEHWGETLEASVQAIQFAQQSGLKVMLKPHMVLVKPADYNGRQYEMAVAKSAFPDAKKLKDKTRGADWRGAFQPVTKADRKFWEANYRQYMLDLAQVAESMAVDLFCIGTELKKSAIRHPEFWRSLINQTREIYNGPLLYSANWDEYDRISFWKQLDFIGVNTYFPINHKKKPGVLRSRRKWRKIRKRLKAFSQKENRKIIFTEFGYRNIYYAGHRPWEHDDEKAEPFDEAQKNLYQAFFKSLWNEAWVAGGFSWKWFADPLEAGNTTFSIQGKPAMEVLKFWYKD